MAKTETTTTNEPTEKKVGNYHYALGRRKTATATVRLFKGNGESDVNGKSFIELYPHKYEQDEIVEVFKAADLDAEKYYFTAKTNGSGAKSQLQAIKLGVARAVVEMDETLKPALKKAGLLTRDPRMVERKKPGLHKARRAEQFSKR